MSDYRFLFVLLAVLAGTILLILWRTRTAGERRLKRRLRRQARFEQREMIDMFDESGVADARDGD